MEERPDHKDALAEVLAPEGDQTAPEGAERVELPWEDFVDTSWDAFDFTAHEQFATVGGRKLNYVELGDPTKPVLLFVHGILGTWRNWVFNLLPFADRYRVIAIDLPGFGLSEMPSDTLTLRGYATAIKQFCDQLGIEKVTLVGNSMGGHVGTLVSLQTPELLQKLILVDPSGFSTSTRRLQKIVPIAPVLEIFNFLGYRIRKFIASNRRIAAVAVKIVLWRPLNVSSELVLILLSGLGKPGFVPALKTIVATRINRQEGTVENDTVIIWGRNDSLIPVGDAYRYARMIPQAKLELLDDVGHIPMFEKPELFNSLLNEHLPAATPAAATAA
jgi:pimeloyl-ACP methyl ester carboxylesterase